LVCGDVATVIPAGNVSVKETPLRLTEAAQSASGTTSLILADVQDASTLNPPAATKTNSTAPVAGQGTFALRFRGISGKPLEQGTYVFNNRAFPRFAMFIVPSGSHPAYYTGLVNRSVQ